PLPDEVLLDPSEIAIIQERVRANNQAIGEICSAAGVPVVDVFALLQEVSTTGRRVAGITLTSDFLSGGIFSYDGVHPSDIGYAVVANEWIRVINQSGGSLPFVNLGEVLGVTAPPVGETSGGALRASASPWVPFELTAEAYAGMLAAFPRLDERP
ncbi:MAG TPA: hypothetical protein VMR21_01590, partial [Vicinamibacteria bacterium]|nr:hypothetical protein [Vicinamibacteria bacterium]